MNPPRRSVFRYDALRRYSEGGDKAVLPRLVSPRIFAYLWILFSLLIASLLLAWFVRIPIYAQGTAVVIDFKDTARHPGGGLFVATFFAPQYAASLHSGQMLTLHFDALPLNLERNILYLDYQVSSPETTYNRYHLSTGAAAAINQPSVAAIASLEPFEKRTPSLPAATYLGSVGQAEVEVGSQRVISLLPLVGQLIGESR